MLYLFTGSDKEKARATFRADLHALRAKKPGASFVGMDELSFSPARIEELFTTRGMFEKAVIAAFTNLLNNEEAAAFLAKNAKMLASSENIFLLCEDDAKKTALAPLEKHADKVWRFTAKAQQKEFPIVFPFAEAFLARDKKKAWILLQKIFSENTPPEQIFGALFWQVKTATLVKKAQKNNTVAALGLKPFGKQNASATAIPSTNSRNFSEKSLTSITAARRAG